MSDSFFPGTFTLSDSAVTAVETNPTDPKTRMDATGFFATDATGTHVVDLSSVDQGLKILAATEQTPPNTRQARWVKSDGGLLLDIHAEEYTLDGGLSVSRSMGADAHTKAGITAGNRIQITNEDSIAGYQQARIQTVINAQATPGNESSVVAQAGTDRAGGVASTFVNQNVKIISSDGTSDLLLSPWKALPGVNTTYWGVNFGGANRTMQYATVGSLVFLRGLAGVKTALPAINNNAYAIAQLPFLPTAVERILGVTFAAGGSYGVCYLYIDTAGFLGIAVQVVGTTPTPANSWVSLDNVIFSTA